MSKTERLAVNVLPSIKAQLEQKAEAEGEPVTVIVRRAIRRELSISTSNSDSNRQPEIDNVPH